MSLYLVYVSPLGDDERFNSEETIADISEIGRANSIKGHSIGKHGRIMQYGGGGAKRLHNLLFPATANRCELYVLKLARDFSVEADPDLSAWLEDAERKGAFSLS